jgi:hypothetical protein
MAQNGNFIREKARETKIIYDCDVVVVGGGPGGIGAAVAAARNGAKTVLIERYGYLGGMGTGGLVTIIPQLADFTGKQQIAGITQEWIDRLAAKNAVDMPKKEHWGSMDKELVRYYFERSFFYTRLDRVSYAAIIDAEISKIILNEMAEEAGIKVFLHAWGTEPIMEGNHMRGVVMESKSGRQAVTAKVVIDSTGDGDLFPYANIACETDIPAHYRIANLAVCFWIAGVDFKKAMNFRKTNPKEFFELMKKANEYGAQGGFMTSNLPDQESVVWFHSRYPNKSQIDVEELTRVEFLGHKIAGKSIEFYRKNIPGFEKAFLVLTDPQLGTRSSRRMIGEYWLTKENDLNNNQPFEDTIAVFPDLDRGQESLDHPNMFIPYRALLPKEVDNMFVACRAFSSDMHVQDYFNLIPHCIAFGEAAGTASALALKSGVKIKDVDIKALQKQLAKQGVPLPDVTKKVDYKYDGPPLVNKQTFAIPH